MQSSIFRIPLNRQCIAGYCGPFSVPDELSGSWSQRDEAIRAESDAVMLIIAGTFEVDPTQRDEFIHSREDAMRRSRQEPGCLAYVFSADPIEPGRVYLFEQWESKDEVAAHLESLPAHPQPANHVLPKSYAILQYEIANFGPLGV
jgi:quinol monooxygenase YgiN